MINMKRLKNSKYTLFTLLKAKPVFRKKNLQYAPDEVIKALRDICHNILSANHQICPKKKNLLKKYKMALRRISRPETKVASTRKILVQHGAGALIPILIGTVLSILSNL